MSIGNVTVSTDDVNGSLFVGWRRILVTVSRSSGTSSRLVRTGEVLDLVRRGVATTTSDIAESMGVARSTVTERLEVLMRHGLVVPAGETVRRRGRPAGMLAFNERAGVTLVAHVGMSEIGRAHV